MSHFFISYAHSDKKFIDKLVKYLDQFSFPIWRDISNIRGSTDWDAEIENAITNSWGIIFYATEASFQSTYVQKELKQALHQHREIFVIYKDNLDHLCSKLIIKLKKYQWIGNINKKSGKQELCRALVYFLSKRALKSSIDDFYINRNGLQGLQKTLSHAQHDWMAVGITLRMVAMAETQPNSFLESEIKRLDGKVRLLFLSPYLQNGDLNPVMDFSQYQTLDNDTRSMILCYLKALYEWKEKHSFDNLEIRGYINIPSTTALLTDIDVPTNKSNAKNHLIHIEPIIAKMTAENRPSFDVSRSSSATLYENLKSAYLRLWDEAIDVEEILKYASDSK